MIKKLIGYGILLALFTGWFAIHAAIFGVVLALAVWTTAIVLTFLTVVAVRLIVG